MLVVKWRVLGKKSLSHKLRRQDWSANQILFHHVHPCSGRGSCRSQMFCVCSWSPMQETYARVRRERWRCTYSIQTLHHLLRILHQLLDLHRITTFRIHSSYWKITTATLTNVYKNPPRWPKRPSPPGGNLYGAMKTTICNIISNYSHYESMSSGQKKEINTYITIW